MRDEPTARRGDGIGAARRAPSRSTSCRTRGATRRGGRRAGREPPRDPRHRQAHLQRRREPRRVSGVSDGGTGAYYVAMRDTTPYASVPAAQWLAHGAAQRGSQRRRRACSQQPAQQAVLHRQRRPRSALSAGAVEPSVDHLRDGGVPIVYRPQPQAGHNTSWWPDAEGRLRAFVATSAVPLPDTVTWETPSTRTSNRAHWLVIDALGGDTGKEWVDRTT